MDTVPIEFLEITEEKEYDYDSPSAGDQIETEVITSELEQMESFQGYYVETTEKKRWKIIPAEENSVLWEKKVEALASHGELYDPLSKQECLCLPENILRLKAESIEKQGTIYGYELSCPFLHPVSLKYLFSDDGMTKYHVDSLMLFQIAKNVLGQLIALNKAGIFPGMLDVSSIIVERENVTGSIKFINVENFQLGQWEQSFEWYPSDSVLFSDSVAHFTQKEQLIADTKLIYKILTACYKKNAKIPPNPKLSKYSEIFWKILSRKWQELFAGLPQTPFSYEEIYEMLKEQIREEKMFEQVHEIDENIGKEPEEKRKKARQLFVLLRDDNSLTHQMSRLLYTIMEKTEQNPAFYFEQAFIYGNQYVKAIPFQRRKKGFRIQLPHKIQKYSFGETLLIAAAFLEEQWEDGVYFRCDFVIDADIKKDDLFLAGWKAMKRVKEEKQIEIHIHSDRIEGSEAYRLLCELV